MPTIDGDDWLSVPQAVFLLATGDLTRALSLANPKPPQLVLEVIFALPPTNFVPLDDRAGETERRKAWRMARQPPNEPSADPYSTHLNLLYAILARGLARVKGSRTREGPIELLDPADVTRLSLEGVDAVHARTGVPTAYDLRVSARDLLTLRESAKLGPSATGKTDALPSNSKPRSTPRPRVRDDQVRRWYKETHIPASEAAGRWSSEVDDWIAAKKQFSADRVRREQVRRVRRELAPSEWRMQGRRSSKKSAE
jgi:hypothetical protein